MRYRKAYRFSEAVEDELVALASTGNYDGPQLMERFNCSSKSLYQVLGRRGVHLPKHIPSTKLTREQELEVIRLVGTGESATAVARKFGMCHTNVRNIFKRHGIVYQNPATARASQPYYYPWVTMRDADKVRGFEPMPLEVFQHICGDPEFSHCCYCGILLERTKLRKDSKSCAFMLDRLRNSRGHIMGNVIPACTYHNMLRQRRGYTIEEMKEFCASLHTEP